MKTIKFCENLVWYRENKKLTQTSLGKLVGVDQRTISAWEKGVCEPSFANLARLCEIFECNFDEMLS